MRKIFVSIDVLVLIAAVGLAIYAASHAEDLFASGNPAAKTTPPSLQVWNDDTAFVNGMVEEHNLPCKTNVACYLKLQIDNTEVRVVYNEGEVRRACANNQAGHTQSIKKGDWIKAFGAYSKKGGIVTISTCASEDYFIRHADEGTPLGPVTERFFNEANTLKSQVAQKQFAQAKRSGQWEIYRDEQLGYEFSYPATWQAPQTSPGAPWSVTYYDSSKTNSDWYTLTLGYISQAQQATMGIDFCAAHPNNSRCERKQIGKVTASIDWGDNSSKTVFVSIPLPEGGLVTFTLEPNNGQAKTLLLPILDTFKVNGSGSNRHSTGKGKS